MILAPFQPFGNTFSRATNSSISTSQSCQLTDALIGATGMRPSQALLVAPSSNTGIVWVNFSNATGTIVIPVSGTGSSAGTPSQAIPLLPGAYVIYTFGGGPALWVQDISTVASQAYYLTLGEGA